MPNLVGVRVSNPFIELFALHDKVAIPRRHDAAPGRSKVNNHVQRCKVSQNQYLQTLQIDMRILSGDCPGGVDVVPGDHTDGDAGSLALLDRGGNLGSDRILE